ncbi:MAG: FAD-dependent monooxygenase [Pseudomonadota bacterium]
MAALRVAVVGSGVVGAAAALQATRMGAQVVLFEPAPPAPVTHPAPDAQALGDWPNRHVALSPASCDLLGDLGLSQIFRHGRFDRMQVWEQLGTAALDLTAAEVGAPVLALMAELPDLTAHLWQQLGAVNAAHAVAAPGALQLLEAPVTGLVPQGHGWRIEHPAGPAIAVDWVLAADGARSAVRALLNAPARTAPTGHSALATVVRTAQPHADCARQRFLTEGPLALLPTRDPQVVSVVWSQPPAAAAARLELDDAAFCASLEVASEGVLGTIEACGPRGAFPIVQLMADDFQPAPRLAFVGDAAHVVHPLAGLGVNLGLEDVTALRPVLAAALALDAGAERRGWRRWRRQRRARSLLVQQSLRGLQRFYGTDGPFAALLRNTGVRAVNGSTLLRRALIGEATGI